MALKIKHPERKHASCHHFDTKLVRSLKTLDYMVSLTETQTTSYCMCTISSISRLNYYTKAGNENQNEMFTTNGIDS